MRIKALSTNTIASNYLVADALGNIYQNPGGTYANNTYRDLVKFAFVNSNGAAGTILASGANNTAIFTQSPSQNIINFAISYQNTGLTSTISAEFVDMTGVSYNNTVSGVSLLNLGALPTTNGVIGTFTSTFGVALTTLVTRPVCVRLTGSSDSEIALSVDLGFV